MKELKKILLDREKEVQKVLKEFKNKVQILKLKEIQVLCNFFSIKQKLNSQILYSTPA